MDDDIEEKIKHCKKIHKILKRMKILEELKNNKEIVISSGNHKGFKGRRKISFSGPEKIIKEFELIMLED